MPSCAHLNHNETFCLRDLTRLHNPDMTILTYIQTRRNMRSNAGTSLFVTLKLRQIHLTLEFNRRCLVEWILSDDTREYPAAKLRRAMERTMRVITAPYRNRHFNTDVVDLLFVHSLTFFFSLSSGLPTKS